MTRSALISPLVLAGTLALGPGAAWGQEVLQPGHQVSGQLAAGESREYQVRCAEGQILEVAVLAEEFRPRLTLLDPQGRRIGQAARSPAAIRHADCARTGMHRVRVQASEGGGGSFRLTATVTRPQRRRSGGGVRPLARGQSVSGSLGPGDPRLLSGEYRDRYVLEARAGQRLTISLSSPTFDAYLIVRCPSGGHIEDDDSGGGHNARVLFTASEAGAYLIDVTSVGVGSQGAYQLTVR